MNTLAGLPPRRARQGFTLLELLLVTVLLMLFIGAMVFSFSTLHQGVELDEGAGQLEALLRFARAQAAHTGRQVKLSFEEEIADGFSVPMGNVFLTWEPDPLGRPGQFEDLPEAAPFVRGLLDLVQIEDVRPLTRSGEPADGDAEFSKTASEDAWLDAPVFAPIVFYPDGSSESAKIVLSSRSAEDPRRIAVRWLGLTGSVRRAVLAESEGEDAEEGDRPSPDERPETAAEAARGSSESLR